MRTETEVTTTLLRKLGDQGCTGSDECPGKPPGGEDLDGVVIGYQQEGSVCPEVCELQIQACAGKSREEQHQLGIGGHVVVGASMLAGNKLDWRQ